MQGSSHEQTPLIGFSGGFRGDGPSIEMPLDAAANIVNLRHDRRGIRKDFGTTNLGDPAPGLIGYIGPYKVITDSEVLERTIRVYRRADGYGVFEFLAPDGWEELSVSDRVISADYLSAVNIHNVMTFADGFGILMANLDGDFEEITGAPQARFIFPFGDRIVALQDGHDKQVMSWCVSGDVTDWSGIGSGSSALTNPRMDQVDALMCGAPLGSNIAAIIRKRSIMRAFLTGDPTMAIGATHWIEGVGTESPFSIQVIPGGVIFLGHNLTAYALSEAGPAHIGSVIRDKLRRDVKGNLHLADSVYDPLRGEYWLGLAEEDKSNISTLWIFDVTRFHEYQDLVWRNRTANLRLLGMAGGAVVAIPAAPSITSAVWSRTASDSQRVTVVAESHPLHTGDVLQLLRNGAVVDFAPGPHGESVTLFDVDPPMYEHHKYTVRHTTVGEQSAETTCFTGLFSPSNLATPEEHITLCSYRITFTTANPAYGLIAEDDYPDGSSYVVRASMELTPEGPFGSYITVSHGASSEPCFKVQVDYRVRHYQETFGVTDYSEYVYGSQSVMLCGDCS